MPLQSLAQPRAQSSNQQATTSLEAVSQADRLPMRPTAATQRTRTTTRSKRRMRFIALAAIAVIVSAFIGTSRELIHRYQVQRDIRALEAEIATLENQNSDLSYLVDYLNTDAFKEIQARQNLGLQRPGETAVLIESSRDLTQAQDAGVGSNLAVGNVNDTNASSGSLQGLQASAHDSLAAALDESIPVAQAPEAFSESRSMTANRLSSWWHYFFRSQPETVVTDTLPSP